jgi:hypothetical protein
MVIDRREMKDAIARFLRFGVPPKRVAVQIGQPALVESTSQ